MRSFLIILFLFFVGITFSSAQVNTSLVSGGLHIETDPAYPEPNSNITATLNNYSIPAKISNIYWKVNGQDLKESKDQRSIQLSTGEAGENITIEVIVSLVNGGSMTAQKTITPAYLDIIVEPQTRVPSFYIGRPIPSIGSTINLTALINGNQTKSSDLVYLWSLDNKVLEGGSVRGKNKISALTPNGKVFLVGLTVSRLNGEIIAKKTLELQAVLPEVVFYEVNSLYGVLHRPISSNLSIVGSSATIKAEPYYLDLLTYNQPSLLEWKIDGNKSQNTNKNPYEITLAGQGDGSSQIKFHVRNLTKLLQGAEGDLRVNF